MPRGIWYDTLRITAAYAGTVVGAGFVSGQELTQFFVLYGHMGFVGIALTGLLFAWLGGNVLELGYELCASGYPALLYYVCGRWLGLFLDWMIVLFLFGVLSIMLAGTGVLLRENFCFPLLAGPALMAAAAAITAWYGVRGVTAASLVITPLLIAATLLISIHSLFHHGTSWHWPDMADIPAQRPAPHWLLASLLYAAYNTVMGITILAPLGAIVPSRRARLSGGIGGGLALAGLAAMIAVVIRLHCPAALECQIPMLYISGQQRALHQIAYTAAFLAAMYSTATLSLYACTAKLQTASGWNRPICLLFLTAGAWLCGQTGFAQMIGVIFPVFGYIALLFVIPLMYRSAIRVFTPTRRHR